MESIITKYRPKSLNEIVGQEEVKEKMIMWIDKARKGEAIPNLMFAGEPGIGKTTFAFVIARELFGEDWKRFVLELNASDERGIDVMRDRVKNFANRCPVFSDVKVNIVILDEADYLTPEAQAILRRLMEDYKNTKFILCCNWISRIIDPLKDRCAIYRLKKYDCFEIEKVIANVAAKENLTGVNIEDIAINCNGSIRKALNMLFNDKQQDEITEKITVKNLRDLLFKYDAERVINKLFEQIKLIKDDNIRIKTAMKLMDAEFNIKFGCNPEIQLHGVVSICEKAS